MDSLSEVTVQIGQLGASEPHPRIGHRWAYQGGIYAGVTRGVNGAPDCHLVVSEQEAPAVAWADACKFAADLEEDGHRDFTLPTRAELALLFANVKELFAGDWHWSGEQCAGAAEYAWFQSFANGIQFTNHKGNELRARAVRRVPLE